MDPKLTLKPLHIAPISHKEAMQKLKTLAHSIDILLGTVKKNREYSMRLEKITLKPLRIATEINLFPQNPGAYQQNQ